MNTCVDDDPARLGVVVLRNVASFQRHGGGDALGRE